MKLKRPPIMRGKWIQNVDTIWRGRNAIVCHPLNDKYSIADATAIACLPEVMDRLEWIHTLLSEEKSHPMTLHELEQTMLKMGYTEEAPE